MTKGGGLGVNSPTRGDLPRIMDKERVGKGSLRKLAHSGQSPTHLLNREPRGRWHCGSLTFLIQKRFIYWGLHETSKMAAGSQKLKPFLNAHADD